MATLMGPSPGPDTAPEDRGFLTLAQVTEAVGRANHLTSLAAWLVATAGVGSVFGLARLGGVRASLVLPLLFLIVPAVAAGGRTVLLLYRAAAAEAIVGGDPGWSTGAVADEPPTAEQVWDRLHLATAALQCRELLARRALLWAYGCAGWFAVWCVVVTVFRR